MLTALAFLILFGVFVVMTISDLGFAFMGMMFKLISEVITGKR